MPDTVKERIKNCKVYLQDEKRRCEHKYGFDGCEECGLIVVPSCPYGFIRTDCSTCARKCPEETETFANGMLCAKPKIIKREIFRDYQLCLQKKGACNKKTETLIISNCDPGWVELGDFLCAFSCPEGFKDVDLYCQPELIMNFDFTYDQMTVRDD